MRGAVLLLVLAVAGCGDSSSETAADASATGGAPTSGGAGGAGGSTSSATGAATSAQSGGGTTGTSGGGGGGGTPLDCPEPILTIEQGSFGDIATDGTNLYVTSLGESQDLLRVPLSGGAPEVIRTVETVFAIVADASGVYWLEHDEVDGDNSLRHWEPSGGVVTRLAAVVGTALGLTASHVIVSQVLGGSGFLASVDRDTGTVVDLGQGAGIASTGPLGGIDGTVYWATRAASAEGWQIWIADPLAAYSLQLLFEGPGGLMSFGTGRADGYATTSQPDFTFHLWRVQPSGSAAPVWTGETNGFGGSVMVDDAHVHWTANGTLYRADLDGAGAIARYDCWPEARNLVQTEDRILVSERGGEDFALRVWSVPK